MKQYHVSEPPVQVTLTVTDSAVNVSSLTVTLNRVLPVCPSPLPSEPALLQADNPAATIDRAATYHKIFFVFIVVYSKIISYPFSLVRSFTPPDGSVQDDNERQYPVILSISILSF